MAHAASLGALQCPSLPANTTVAEPRVTDQQVMAVAGRLLTAAQQRDRDAGRGPHVCRRTCNETVPSLH